MPAKEMTAAEKSLHNQENLLPRPQLLSLFSALALVLCVCFIDQNGVSVALPTIATDLSAEATISWAGTSSLIANTVFSVLYGRLSDIFGRKPVFLAACGMLAVADLLCGLSQNAPMFYVFRAVAGLSGGGITNLTMIIVSDVVSLQERGKYQGILGACVGVGNIVGPFVAAGFVQSTTWRGYFWLLAPLVTVCGVISFFMLPSSPPTTGFWENVRKIDHWGVLASSVAIVFLLIPISGGGAYFPWASPMVIAMLAIGSCALLLYVGVEWKVADLPMMPLSMFANRAVCTLLVQSFLLGWVYQSYLYYLPLYYQNARQYSPIVSAALTIPVLAIQSTSSVLSGQYISRRGRYIEVLWLGFGAWTLGCGLTVLFDRTTHPAVCSVILAIVGLGVGNIFQPTLVALQAHSPKAQRAVVVSNRNFFRCCGGACGLAVSAAVLQASLRSALPQELKHLSQYTYSLSSIANGPEREIVLDAYATASRNVFIMQVPLMGICLAGCFLIKDFGLQRQEPVAPDVPQEPARETGAKTEKAGV